MIIKNGWIKWWMRWPLQRRRSMVIAFIICIIYLLHQIISLKQLNLDLFNDLKANTINQEQHNLTDPAFKSINIESQLMPNDDDDHRINKQHPNTININGLLPKYHHLYANNDLKTTFKCIASAEEIPFAQVNDDYCDCKDGSDEPSTSACPQNIFYCQRKTFQGKINIPSHRVNDGICDCCDGSDEWKNVLPPLSLSGNQFNAIKQRAAHLFQAPCGNRC